MELPDLNEDVLKVILMLLLTALCISLYRVIPKYFGKGNSAQGRPKGNWVRNRHIRSVKEAEFVF